MSHKAESEHSCMEFGHDYSGVGSLIPVPGPACGHKQARPRNISEESTNVGSSDDDSIALPRATEEQHSPGSVVNLTGSQQPDRPGSSVCGSVVNLTKNLIGTGILACPKAFVDGSVAGGLLGAIVLGAASGVGFWSIGFCCGRTGERTFHGVWSACVAEKSAWLIDVAVISNTIIGCAAFNIVIADYAANGLTAVADQADAPDWFVDLISSRWLILFFCSICFMLPLSLKRDISTLRPFSLVGLLAVGYAIVYLVCDVLLDLSKVEGDRGVPELDPSVLTGLPDGYKGISCTLSILASGFSAHYNAPRFYSELHAPTAPRFAAVTVAAFALTATLSILVGLAGVARFGTGVQGDVLKSYGADASSPFAVLLMWIAMAAGTVLTYPLAMSACRDSVMAVSRRALAGRAIGEPAWLYTVVTVALVFGTGVVGAHCQDLGPVLSAKGATNMVLAFIFPGILCLGLRSRGHRAAQFDADNMDTSLSGQEDSKGIPLSLVVLSYLLIFLGCGCTIMDWQSVAEVFALD